MGSDLDDIESSALSTAPTQPSGLSRTSIANSNGRETSNPDESIDVDDTYVGFPWNRYRDYAKCEHLKGNWSSWVWDHGYKVQNIQSQHIYWICRTCLHQKQPNPARYRHTAGTANMARHLEEKHHIGKDGPVQKRRRITDCFQRDGETGIQAHINRRVEGFNPERFRRALLRWVASSNIAFLQIENEPFRRLMLEANSNLERAGCLPSSTALKEWIMRDFDYYFGVANEVLASFKWRVHFTFDLWTSGNHLCLNGVFAHWLDDAGNKRKLLLSIPSINESHTGDNIAIGIEDIIRKFGLEQRIGFFVLDNAGNCTTAVESLARTFGFDSQQRRLRCAAHVFNLVAMQIMYGTDLSAFERDNEDVRQLQDDLERWRNKGALGKLRNLIYWITDKHADSGRTRQFERIQEEQPCLDNRYQNRKQAGLKRPNDTRWNSDYYAFEAAIVNRNAIDLFSLTETQKYKAAVDQIRQKNASRAAHQQQKEPPQPVIVKDALDQDDWMIIPMYMEVLKPLMLATKKLEGVPQRGKFARTIIPSTALCLSAVI